MNLYPEDAFLLQVLKLCGYVGTVMMYFTPRILIFDTEVWARSIIKFQLDFSNDTTYLGGILGLGHAQDPVSIYGYKIC